MSASPSLVLPSNDERFLLELGGLPKFAAEGDFDFNDCMVHQMIETIEFSLGTVSNTASYLRLWALSLAHSQLAKVFFSAVLGALNAGSAIQVAFAFPVFAMATLCVLMGMDVLECFLHVLRLHWVEFQNKFYKGDGYAFGPLNYKANMGFTK